MLLAILVATIVLLLIACLYAFARVEVAETQIKVLEHENATTVKEKEELEVQYSDNLQDLMHLTKIIAQQIAEDETPQS